MQRRRFQSRFVLTVILLAATAGPLIAQSAVSRERPALSPTAESFRTVIPADLYVDDDNAGAQDGSALHPYRTVQQAIDAAAKNAVIAVAQGTYPQNIRVQEKAVRLYGGYVGGTKADYAGGTVGNFKVRDPAAHPSHLKGNGKDSVVTLYEAGASIVDGFQISGGGRSSVAVPSWIGGGFYVYAGSPTISNNVIEKNQTCPPVKQEDEKLGGGIYSTGASLSILNNLIRNNVSGRGAGIFADGPKLVIRGNIIQNNIGVSDHGGGVFIFSPNAEFSHNRVEGNEIGREMGYGWGGGMIVVNEGGHFKLAHNVFTGNYAPSLGSAFFADEGAAASMDHDLVYDNKCSPNGEGGAVYVDGNESGIGSTLTLNHVTIADHIFNPDVKGNAVKATWNSRLVVKNCILWNNGGDDVEADEKSKATVTYTLSQETIKGAGNLSKDPLFVDATKHDYRLRPNSPAIGTAELAGKKSRANLGADVNAGPVSKPDSNARNIKSKAGSGTKEKHPAEKTSKTYLLRGTAGELPSETGDDSTKMSKVASEELGGTAVQIELIDSFGQSKAKVQDWSPFRTLHLNIVNQGEKEFEAEFNLFHSETKTFATRVVAPFVLKPGNNEVRIAISDLKNTNGSPANLAEVRRWYVASATPVTLLIGDIFLESE